MDAETTDLSLPVFELCTPRRGDLAHAETHALAMLDTFDARDATWARVDEDDLLTQPCEAITSEQAPLDALEPLPHALEGDPAYLIELRAQHRKPSLFAVRATLREAQEIADAIHPSIGDVVIREMPLPCDVDVLARALGRVRTWTREASGEWWPPLD
jgi:hypothetical protein